MVDKSGQAGAEIEITPEMIDAGVGEFLSTLPEDVYDTPEIIIADIYRCMSKLAPRLHS